MVKKMHGLREGDGTCSTTEFMMWGSGLEREQARTQKHFPSYRGAKAGRHHQGTLTG